MKKIQPGELFIYQVNSKYGVIQIIEKSKLSGYNVRIFCDLFDDISFARLELIVQGNYYFIKDFYEAYLLKSNFRILYNLPKGLIMPKYMRSCERQSNGKLLWFIIDVKNGKIVKKFNTFNNDLINLSPAETWGLEYIKARWIEGFSLEKWHIFEEKWYIKYLKEYESIHDTDFDKILNDNNFFMNNYKYSSEIISHLKSTFDVFQKELSYCNINSEKKIILKNLITTLNKINEKYMFIGTIESEKIIEYIHVILLNNNILDGEDIIDMYREW